MAVLQILYAGCGSAVFLVYQTAKTYTLETVTLRHINTKRQYQFYHVLKVRTEYKHSAKEVAVFPISATDQVAMKLYRNATILCHSDTKLKVTTKERPIKISTFHAWYTLKCADV